MVINSFPKEGTNMEESKEEAKVEEPKKEEVAAAPEQVAIVNDLLLAAHGHLNVPGFLGEVLDKVVKDALQKIVDDTDTPFDNVIMDALYPLLSSTAKAEIQKLWDGLVPAPAAEAKPGELI